MNLFNTIVLIGIVVLAIPAFIAGGWMIFLVLGAVWLLLTIGGREAKDILVARQSGASAAKVRSRSLSRDTDDGQRWDR